GGNLSAMAEQVQGAIAWTYRNAERFGGDRKRIFVSGHSSGGSSGNSPPGSDNKREGQRLRRCSPSVYHMIAHHIRRGR
ncbi:MAG: hypothetical protein ACXVCT_20830, partial [Ktedonobacterales bacterium]